MLASFCGVSHPLKTGGISLCFTMERKHSGVLSSARFSMKVGDLVRHNGNHSLWIVTSVEAAGVFITRRGYTIYAEPRAYEVISESR